MKMKGVLKRVMHTPTQSLYVNLYISPAPFAVFDCKGKGQRSNAAKSNSVNWQANGGDALELMKAFKQYINTEALSENMI